MAGGECSYLSSPPLFFFSMVLLSPHGANAVSPLCTYLACRCDNILLCHTLCIPYRERVHGVGVVWVWRGAGGVHTPPPFVSFSYLGLYMASHTFFVVLFVIPCFSLTFSLSSCALGALGIYGHMDTWAWQVYVCLIDRFLTPSM